MDKQVQHIMKSDLPNALQLTWIAMWGASTDGLYADSIAQIGRERGISRQAAQKQVQRLIEWGAVERLGNAYRLLVDIVNPDVDDRNPDVDDRNPDVDDRNPDVDDRNPGDDDVNPEENGFHFPASPLSPKKEYHSTPFHPSTPTLSQGGGDAKAPPSWIQDLMSEISWQAEPLPDDHPARWEYHPEDWRWEAANYVLRELWADQRLPSRLNRRLEEGDVKPGKIASKWADTFRLLVEQDGYSREVIRYTIRWLFEIDDWWIESGNFQSASNSALRSRDQDGTHKFDKLVQRARSHYEQQKQKRTDAAEIRRGWDEAIEEYEANRSAESTGDAIPSEPEVGGAAV